jgi:hypothetical protein
MPQAVTTPSTLPAQEVLSWPESFEPLLGDLVPKVVPWDSPEGPGANQNIPEPLGGRLVWVRLHNFELRRTVWYIGWSYHDGKGRWACTTSTDGLVVYCYDRAAPADWLPQPYPADVFPLGYTRAHLAAWRWYVLGRMPHDDHNHPDAPGPLDSTAGPEVLLAATRLLAHRIDVIGPDRLAAPIPDTPGGIRREVFPLLDAMLTGASKTGGPPKGTANDAGPNVRDKAARTAKLAEVLILLKQYDGNVSRVASELGIHRNTIKGWPEVKAALNRIKEEKERRKDQHRGERSGPSDFAPRPNRSNK